MKIRIIPEAFDMVPPGMLEQLQVAFAAAAAPYGYKLKSEIAPDEQFEANERYWNWAFRDASKDT